VPEVRRAVVRAVVRQAVAAVPVVDDLFLGLRMQVRVADRDRVDVVEREAPALLRSQAANPTRRNSRTTVARCPDVSGVARMSTAPPPACVIADAGTEVLYDPWVMSNRKSAGMPRDTRTLRSASRVMSMVRWLSVCPRNWTCFSVIC